MLLFPTLSDMLVRACLDLSSYYCPLLCCLTVRRRRKHVNERPSAAGTKDCTAESRLACMVAMAWVSGLRAESRGLDRWRCLGRRDLGCLADLTAGVNSCPHLFTLSNLDHNTFFSGPSHAVSLVLHPRSLCDAAQPSSLMISHVDNQSQRPRLVSWKCDSPARCCDKTPGHIT